MSNRGFFGIGIINTKTEANIGTLWRSAYNFGASFIYTIGKRYKHQCSDTTKAWRQIPLYHYNDFDQFYSQIPYDCKLVGIELDDRAHPIKNFVHNDRSIYLLGAEDLGIPKEYLNKCHSIIQLPGVHCLNVASSGTIVMFDRINKQNVR